MTVTHQSESGNPQPPFQHSEFSVQHSPPNPLLASSLDLFDVCLEFQNPNPFEIRRGLISIGIHATDAHIQEFLTSDKLKNYLAFRQNLLQLQATLKARDLAIDAISTLHELTTRPREDDKNYIARRLAAINLLDLAGLTPKKDPTQIIHHHTQPTQNPEPTSKNSEPLTNNSPSPLSEFSIQNSAFQRLRPFNLNSLLLALILLLQLLILSDHWPPAPDHSRPARTSGNLPSVSTAPQNAPTTPLHIAIIGDGAMATVCSQIVAGKSSAAAPVSVHIWGRDPARLAAMNASRENTHYLPGTKLAPNIHAGGDDASIFQNADLVICAVPTQYIRPALERLAPVIPAQAPVVSVAKGIEITTLRRPSEIIRELLAPRTVAALSGPSIAGELARKLPATMVVASIDSTGAHGDDAEALSKEIQELFTTPYLRVYRNDDLLGVELAGALKNVIALAAGILDGMRAGNNAKAALLTRGLVEITRLGIALGAQADTFAGLAGLGDLVTTCVSPEGRNRSFGERVGRGEKPTDVLASMVGVVEGVPTCESVVRLARARRIPMPISEGLHAVLFEGRDPQTALADLMARELKSE